MFNRFARAIDVARTADLRGRLALVTGATSGLGFETARALGLAGADLLLCARDRSKANQCADRLRAEAGRNVAVHVMDLCDFASVRGAATAIARSHPRIDLLIANAGASKTPSSHQQDGIDVRFAGNHLGHFLLANLLLPQMAVRGARIVMVSSAAHRGRPVQFDDLGWNLRRHDEFAAYGESKSANILFAIEATRRWASRNITANAVLPGTIMTGLQRYHGDELKRRMGFIDTAGNQTEMVRTVEQGAATLVWAAVASELEGTGGLILEDCAVARPHTAGMHSWSGYDPAICDAQAARELWDASHGMLAALGHRC